MEDIIEFRNEINEYSLTKMKKTEIINFLNKYNIEYNENNNVIELRNIAKEYKKNVCIPLKEIRKNNFNKNFKLYQPRKIKKKGIIKKTICFALLIFNKKVIFTP